MACYFQGCEEKGTTKEHIPPRSFFPEGEKHQLVTVKSCPAHNNAKSKDDLYVLAQICMHASPANRAREVWLTKVAPQLEFNGGKLRDMLAEGAVQVEGGVAYPVRIERLDEFFTALSCGLIAASQKRSLPANYSINHIYPSLATGGDSVSKALEQGIEEFYTGKPLAVMEFGKPGLHNERIYTAEVFGLPDFEGSITIVHLFFGKFKVISMLSKLFEMPA